MDDLQYNRMREGLKEGQEDGFKPCYKWMTFNTDAVIL